MSLLQIHQTLLVVKHSMIILLLRSLPLHIFSTEYFVLTRSLYALVALTVTGLSDMFIFFYTVSQIKGTVDFVRSWFLKFRKEKVISNNTYIQIPTNLNNVGMLPPEMHHSLLLFCQWCNMFHDVPNDQQTQLQFVDILNKQLVDMLLMMSQIEYAIRLRLGYLMWWMVIWALMLPAPETIQCHGHCMGERCPAKR